MSWYQSIIFFIIIDNSKGIYIQANNILLFLQFLPEMSAFLSVTYFLNYILVKLTL